MKALFNYIKERINDRVPEIKTVRVWNNQFYHSLGEENRPRIEKAFKYPACFVEFQTMETFNRALGIVDIVLAVRFRFGIEGYKLERLETLDFCNDFIAAIQLMAPTDESGLTFTTFQQVASEFDDDADNVEQPIIEYRTMYRSLAGYSRKQYKTINNATPTPSIDIVTEI
jgi:hypothetical protein